MGPCYEEFGRCDTLNGVVGSDRFSMCFDEDKKDGKGWLVWNEKDHCAAGSDPRSNPYQGVSLVRELGEWAIRTEAIHMRGGKLGLDHKAPVGCTGEDGYDRREE